MALLEQITNQLNNPAPTFEDPEQDSEDVTQAQITYSEDNDGNVEAGTSQLRRRAASFLTDTDKKYAGKKISRKNLDWFEDEVSETESEGRESNSEKGSDGKLESDSVSEEDSEENDEKERQLELFNFKVKQAAKNHDADDGFRFEDDRDYSKYVDSLDEDDDENLEDDKSMEDKEDDDSDHEKSDENALPDGQDKQEVLQITSTDHSDEVAKGRAAIAQLGVWDSMMEGRIKVQKLLVLVNQLPQPDVWKRFVIESGDSISEAAEKAQSMLQQLLVGLLQLQAKLLLANPITIATVDGTGDKEVLACSSDEVDSAALKRKSTDSEFEELHAKRHAGFCTYRNETLHKWHDKTRLFSKKLKSFSAFDVPVVKQIDQVLSDRDRLVRRTQVKRSSYCVIGKAEIPEKPEPSSGSLEVQAQLVHDPEIFDDDDFYHQLLRDLIERKGEDSSDPTLVSRQWLEIQKLRSKAKRKNVDTRASKGRKLRYNVHNKLVNFMAPVDASTWSTEAKNDLFASLFKDAGAVVER